MKDSYLQSHKLDLADRHLLYSKSLIWSALLLALAWQGEARAAVDWPVPSITQITGTGFGHPTCISHAGDGSQRLFVTEQAGRVWIIKSNDVLPQPFLDITSRVMSSAEEQGLLGLAFPPGFATNQHFYVNYTRPSDGAGVISRFQLTTNSNVADTNSEQVILVIPEPTNFNSHFGGQLAFGPDGFLYIGLGDGSGGLGLADLYHNAQQTNTRLGKLLRIDVESGVSPYAIPTNNPFIGKPGALPEIWAFGLCNPAHFSFDRLSGDFYLADPGLSHFDEIDFQPASSPGGQNYGWPIMEGPSNNVVPPGFSNFLALTLPVAWYGIPAFRGDDVGITGGYVYRGPSVPRMDGIYFYSDSDSGRLWGLKQDGTNWQTQLLLDPISVFPGTYISISTFGEDDRGQLYLADYLGGEIYQLQDSQQACTPAFSPSGGSVNSYLVLVTCGSTNAEIHYTTNGADPTLSDPFIFPGSTIQVSRGFTNKARAFRPDLTPSTVASAVFDNLIAGTPIFTPPPGSLTNQALISISTVTPGATIFYTTDGSTPSTNSLVYTNSLLYTFPPSPNGSITVRAIAVGGGYWYSSVASASYSAARVTTPLFNPFGGSITNGTLISMTCATPGAAIFYSVDTYPPTTNSTLYSGPFPINGGDTVNAFAFETGYVDSQINGVNYTVSPQNPIVLSIDLSSLAASGQVQLHWQTVTGKTYAVQYSSDLTSWTNLVSSISGDGSIASVTDPTTIAQAGQRYYRVAVTGL